MFCFFSLTEYQAQAQTWTGSSSGNWSTSTNWSIPPAFGASTDLTFSATGTNSTTATPSFLGSNLTIRSLTFDAGVSTDLSVRFASTYNGNSASNLILSAASGSAGISIASGATGNVTFTVGTAAGSIVANSALLIDNNGSGTLSIAPPISGTGSLTKNGTGALTLSGNSTYTGDTAINAGTLQISSTGRLGGGSYSGNIANSAGFIFGSTSNQTLSGIISGTGSLTKNSTGTLSLSGNNSYTGSITVRNGTVTLAHANALGAGGDITFTGGGLQYGAGTSTDISARIKNSTATILLDTNGNDVSFASVLDSTNTLGLTKNGTGSLSLSGNNTYSGNTTINAGTLEIKATGLLAGGNYSGGITNKGNFLFGSDSNQILSGVISSTGFLTKNGTGTLSLSGNNTYNGTTTINAGTLEITSTGRLGNGTYSANISNNGRFIIGSSNTQTLSGMISGTGSLTQNGSGTLTLSGNNTYTGDTAINSGTLQVSAAGVLGGGSYGGNIANAGAFIFASNSSQTLSGFMSGTGSLTKNGTGTLTISGSNSYTGSTTIRNGTITVGHANALGSGGNITFTGGGLQYGTGITTDISSRIKNSTSTILIDTNGNNVSFASVLDTTNTLGLTKNGTGTLSLSGNNTYNGTTTINAGTLEITATGLLGGGNYSGNITNKGNFLFGSDSNQTLSGIISSTGSLTKNGTGALTLSGNSTYSGDTAINAGTLQISSTGRLGGGSYSGNIANSAGFIFGSTSNQTLSGIISGTGFLTKNGTGTLSLSGNNTYTGSTTVRNGTITLAHANALGSGGDITFTGGGLQYGAGTTTDVSARIKNSTTAILIDTNGNNVSFASVLDSTNTLGLTKNGTGALSLSGNNTYSGNTTINAGTLEITATGLLAGGNYSGNIANSGAFLFGSDSNQILSGIISSTGSLTKNGTGTLSLSANNTYNGTTSINAGTLEITATGRLGGGTYSANISNNGSFIIGSNSNQTLAGIISGTGSLTKNGTGALTLSGNSTYSGDTAINSGTLQVSSTGLLGGGNYSGNISNAGAFIFASNSSQSLAGMISGTGSFTKNSTGTLTISGSNSYTGSTTIRNGTITLAHANALGSGGDITFTGGGLQYGAGTTTDVSARIKNSTTAILIDTNGNNVSFASVLDSTNILGLTKNGTGALSLSGNNTYSGNTTINTGTLEITATGLLAGGNYSGSITNKGNFLFGSDSNQILSGIISSTGSLTKNGSGTLTLSANSTYTGDTAINTGTLEITSTGRLGAGAYSGNISNAATFLFASTTNQTLSGIISGTGSLTKNGTSILTLSGNNTYSGTTTVRNGTITLAHANALGSGGNITFTGGGLQYGVGTATDISARIKNSTAAILVDTNGNNVSFASVLDSTNTLGLTKNGTGALSLSGNNTYSGTTTINTGTLEVTATGLLGGGAYSGNITNKGNFLFGSDSNQILSGIISSTGSLTKNGTGTLSLSGNNTYNGTTTINDGTLEITATGRLGSGTYSANISNNGSFIIGSSNTQTLSGIISGTGSLTQNGSGTLTLSGNNTYTGDTAINSGTLQVSAAGVLGGGYYSGNIANAGAFIFASNSSQTLSGFMSGTGSLTKNGTGTLSLSGNNTYSGTTTINTGTLEITATGLLGGGNYSGNITNKGNFLLGSDSNQILSGIIISTGSLTKNGTGTLSLSGNNTYNGTTTINDGILEIAATGRLGGGNYSANISNTGSFIIGSTNNQTLSGIISGTGSLTQNGSGTLTLSGNSTYTGDTVINTGTLQVSSAGRLGGGSYSGDIANTGVFIFGSNSSQTLSGIISGTGSLTKNGTSSLSLAGNNAYSGTTTINSGTLEVTATGLLGGGNYSGDITNKGNFLFGSNSNQILSGVISGNGSFSKNGTGTLSLSGNNTYNGTTSINAGTLEITATGRLGGGNYSANISNTGSFIIGSNNNQTLSGIISGTGALTKNGSGVLTLSGNSTYSGNTAINGGALKLGSNGSLSSSSAVSISSGAVFDTTAKSSYSISTAGITIGVDVSGAGFLNANSIILGNGLSLSMGTTTPLSSYNLWDTSGSVTGSLGTVNLQGLFTGNLTRVNSVSWSGTIGGYNFNLNESTGNFTSSIAAGQLYWAANGVSLGGSETWNATNTNWSASDTVVSGTTWSSSQTAVFKGTAGNVAVNALTANAGLSFETNGYTISGGTITLGGEGATANTIKTASGVNATISAELTGSSGFTKTGTGTLVLTGINTYTGVSNVSSGILEGTTSSLAGNFINDASLVFNQSTAGSFSGNITGIGSLTKNGSGSVTLSGNNSYSGPTTINAGVLAIGSGTAIGNSSAVTIAGGTLAVGNQTQTLSSLSMSSGALIIGSGNLTLGAGSSVTGGNMTFDSASTGQMNTNGTLTLGNATFVYNHTAASTQGIVLSGNIAVTSFATAEFNNSGAGSGRINLGAATRVFDIATAANMNVGWIIASTTASGNLTKNGTGVLTLSGNNTYTGRTTINSGTLQIAGTGLLGGGSYAGAILNNATFIIGSTNNQTLSGIISGTGSLTQNGSGTLTLSGNSTYSGDTAINAGTLQVSSTGRLGGGSYSGNIANSGGFIFASNSNQTLSGIISGIGSLTKNGTGKLSLSGNNAYTGSTTVRNGTITLVHANALGVGGDITFSGGGLQYGTGITTDISSRIKNSTAAILIDTNGNNVSFDSAIDSTNTLGLTKNGTGALTLSSNNNYTGGTTINSGTLTISGVGQLGSGSYSGNISNAGSFVYSSSANQTLFGIISGTGSFTKSGAGTLTLAGVNTNTGDIAINDGILTISGAGQLASGSYSGNISNAGNFNYGSSAAQTLSGIISGNGTLAKNGIGTLTLIGNNTYTGGTTLNSGTLVIGNTAAAGSGSITQTDGTSLLKFNTTGTITNAMSLYNVQASQSVTLSGAIIAYNDTYTVDSGVTMTISGNISGAGGTTKNGTGTLVLSGNNTYTGTTTVNSGTLEAASAKALGSTSNVTVSNGGSLLVTANNAIGTTGGITLDGGTLAFGSSGYNGTVGALTLSANSTIDLGDSANGVILRFGSVNWSDPSAYLAIYNWTGTTLWQGGNGDNKDQVYFGNSLTTPELQRISFYSGFGTGFSGNAFQIMNDAPYNYQIIGVPEPETYATALLLALGAGVWIWKQRSKFSKTPPGRPWRKAVSLDVPAGRLAQVSQKSQQKRANLVKLAPVIL